jgi:uncharacterized iron-regulated membrane protein
MGASLNYYTKKAHRYLGVFIGLQFLLWTVGGLYFSWTNIEEIRGEHLRHGEHGLTIQGEIAPPSVAIKRLKEELHARSIQAVSLSQVLGDPYYKIDFEDSSGKRSTAMADAATGDLREAFTEKEAVEIAAAEMSKPSDVVSTELLTESDVGGHHEYRDKPLPAYAITYSQPSGTVVYVSKQAGRVESVRTNAWRVFDFFWLFHTLDFYGRDDINNYVLRAFSLLGLVTIFSGYLLFFITSPWLRKNRGKRNSN